MSLASQVDKTHSLGGVLAEHEVVKQANLPSQDL